MCGGGCCSGGCCSPGCCGRGIELRMGILYGCDCFRFNGLQDQCPRSECQGCSPCCFTGSCCAAKYPLSFACMTHGIDIRRVRACCPGPASVATALGYCC